jgi:hypothetical protein
MLSVNTVISGGGGVKEGWGMGGEMAQTMYACMNKQIKK